jgi:hypothetical protein
VAVVWLVFGLSRHLYMPFHFAVAAIVSVAVYAVARAFSPNRTFEIPDPEPAPKPTGNPELDALVAERDKAVGEMQRLNDNIKDEKISAQIEDLENTTKKIIAYVVSSRQAASDPQVYELLPAYHPEASQLLRPHGRYRRRGRQYRRHHGQD